MMEGLPGNVMNAISWINQRRKCNEKGCSEYGSLCSHHSPSKVVICGHNVKGFDLPVIVNNIIREGEINLVQNSATGEDGMSKLPLTHVVDTLDLVKDQELWKKAKIDLPKENNKLGALYEHALSKKIENAHSALGDVKANLELLLCLDEDLVYTMSKIESFTEWLKTHLRTSTFVKDYV